jgi:hypothetical protein
MWAEVRELLHFDWNPTGVGDFIALSCCLSGPFRRLVWFTFAAQCWTLWNVRNKLAIEGKLIGNPAASFTKLDDTPRVAEDSSIIMKKNIIMYIIFI